VGKFKGNKNRRLLLPFFVIDAAINGDEDAIDTVLLHFEGYITAFATWKMRDEHGNVRKYINETIRDELRNKLIKEIRKFKVA